MTFTRQRWNGAVAIRSRHVRGLIAASRIARGANPLRRLCDATARFTAHGPGRGIQTSSIEGVSMSRVRGRARTPSRLAFVAVVGLLVMVATNAVGWADDVGAAPRSATLRY